MFAYNNDPNGQASNNPTNNNIGASGSPDNMMMQASKMTVSENEPQMINEFNKKLDMAESDSLAEGQAAMLQERKPSSGHFTIVNSNINVSKISHEDSQNENLGTEIYRQLANQNNIQTRLNMESDSEMRSSEIKEANFEIKDNNVSSNNALNLNKEGTNM